MEKEDMSTEEQDIKPIFPVMTENATLSASESPKKWSPGLQDTSRKSAFLPYKVYTGNTVLTNLQRGNTLAENVLSEETEVDFHMKAGQGELCEQDILKEGDVDVKDSNNLTALHWASFYGQLHTVQLLVKHGAQVNILGSEEESPLILAASGGHHDIVAFLISHGADVNHVDHMCNSALMYAAKGNHPHTCQELILNGINISLINLNEDSAHSIAVANNSTLAQTVIENFLILQVESGATSSKKSGGTVAEEKG
ncbi:DNA-binding protein RFXANK-like [Diorhabda sublineata]|uniref:DNA-binding protein RFXANK-like n=1 Tax=Diorhabda sublineata TaxID=1163346 RepID=UPI0024E118B1|nr:DNA-binding protein RFXANK-like [Diorhabda sublineata]